MLSVIIAVKFAGYKGLPAFGCPVNENNRKRIAGHEVQNIHELADKRGAHGAILNARRVNQGQDVIVADGSILGFLGIVVQRPRANGDRQPRRGILYHLPAAFGELIDSFLVGKVNACSDNLHDISFLAYHHQQHGAGRAEQGRSPVSIRRVVCQTPREDMRIDSRAFP